jgi:hypothetical protein
MCGLRMPPHQLGTSFEDQIGAACESHLANLGLSLREGDERNHPGDVEHELEIAGGPAGWA